MRFPAVGLLPALGAIATLALAGACGGENQGASPAPVPAPSKPASTPASAPDPAAPSAPADPARLAERGRGIYMSNCIACHNPNPSLDGALGPAVGGASEELIEARVIVGTYPDGYVPKRETRVMVAMPHLLPEIPALAAYLK